MAVRPLGEAPYQAILRGQDEAPVLFKVRVLEHIQQLGQGAQGRDDRKIRGHITKFAEYEQNARI